MKQSRVMRAFLFKLSILSLITWLGLSLVPGSSVLAGPPDPQAPSEAQNRSDIHEMKVTGVEGEPNSILVKWKTTAATKGWIKYGTRADNLNQTVYDTRGKQLVDTTHWVVVKHADPSIEYFFAIFVDGKKYDNGAAPYQMRVPKSESTDPLRPSAAESTIAAKPNAEPTPAPDAILDVKASPTENGVGGFMVKWKTSVPEQGWLEYGTRADRLDRVAYDVRGKQVGDTTHWVVIPAKEPAAKYYYTVVTHGRRYDNNGMPFEIAVNLSSQRKTTPEPQAAGLEFTQLPQGSLDLNGTPYKDGSGRLGQQPNVVMGTESLDPNRPATPAGRPSLIAPFQAVNGVLPSVSCGYGCAYHQDDSYNGTKTWHEYYALDFSLNGTSFPVVAAATGTLTRHDEPGFGGGGTAYTVFIDHGNGWKTKYTHLNNVMVRGQAIANGASTTVVQGEVIGNSGSTGASSIHLHFELRAPYNAGAYAFTGDNTWSYRVDETTNGCLAQSQHPYVDNTNITLTLMNPDVNATATRVHFSRIETESNYDYVYVRDGSSNQMNVYNGAYSTGVWSSTIPGRSVKVQLTSDGSITAWGFCVDRVESVSTTTLPAAPSNAQATVLNSTQIRLNWIDNSTNETAFIIYDGSTTVATVGANTTSYTVGGLAPGSYHCYQIAAYNAYGSSARTNWACATTPAQASCIAQSPHPYSDNYNTTWTLTNPDTNASSTRIHFSRLEVEYGYDYVYVRDGNNTETEHFTGAFSSGVWSGTVPGRTVKVQLTSDGSITTWGFCVDSIQTVSTTPSEVVVDELSAGFTKGGSYWQDDSSRGYNGHMYWTYVNGGVVDSWGQWRPNLPASRNYEVYVYVPDYHTNTTSARYTVYYQGGASTVTRSQSSYYNQWVSLGTFSFAAGTAGYVRLTDATGEAAGSKQIGFDALKWVPR